MKRPHQNAGASGASQRRLRVGELVRHVLLFSLISAPAFAEVCDKAVGESWRPEQGPVWLLNPMGFPIGMTVLTGGLIFAGLARSEWPGFVLASLIFLLLALGSIPDPDSMWPALQKEGCASERTDFMNTCVLGAFGLAYVLLGFRARMRRAKAL